MHLKLKSMQCKEASHSASSNLHLFAAIHVNISHAWLSLHRKHVRCFIVPRRCFQTACLQQCLRRSSFKQSVHSLLIKSGAQTSGVRCQMHWTVWTVLTSTVFNDVMPTPTYVKHITFKLIHKQLLRAHSCSVLVQLSNIQSVNNAIVRSMPGRMC